MRHFLTLPQLRVLKLIHEHGPAEREPRLPPGDWVWMLTGKTESGGVDRLIRAGCVETKGDTAVLTEKGQRIAREQNGHS
jgi:DNA-binding MarR family transcriptional regulator